MEYRLGLDIHGQVATQIEGIMVVFYIRYVNKHFFTFWFNGGEAEFWRYNLLILMIFVATWGLQFFYVV